MITARATNETVMDRKRLPAVMPATAQRTVKLRPASYSDISRVMYVCDQAWKGVWEGEYDMFADRIKSFPEAGIVVAELNGVIEGYISIQLADDETLLRPTWNEATDYGHFCKTHKPDGEWIHGAGLAITAKGSRANLAGKLVQYLVEYMIENNKKGGRFITRLPGYYKYANQYSAEEYVLLKRGNKPLDPEIRVLSNYGFSVVTPPLIFPDYVDNGGDPNSMGKSVLIERLNPFWQPKVI
jgi:hypothetical protein